MTQIPPPSDPIEGLGEAYELVLERLLDRFHVRDPHHRPKDGEVEEWIDQATQEAAPHLDAQQKTQVKTAVARDLHSLSHYRKRGGTDAEGWLGFERQRLEGKLLELIPKIADPTLSEWLTWKADLEHQTYRTGELTGPGVLICNQCGERLHFTRAGRIPPCPKCGGTVFHRAGDEEHP